MDVTNKYQIETSTKSSRKYPDVVWFPRSKTDPREIREVLKLALTAQESNPGKFFNDKILGEMMARVGSINVIGLGGNEYIDHYEGKSTANISYITNARMLMRLFRFLGFVTRQAKGKYVLTELGKIYCTFSGDFPNYKNGLSEEKILLESLSNFAFYSVNDDGAFRDAKFRMRPFYWLLRSISLEPQCMYQLIVTAFASKSEGNNEVERIQAMLSNLRNGTTNLKSEWHTAGLDADNYSCVHNFYDSAKILVYLGISLGLIKKTSNPVYGKKISGNARHLKQATVFYDLTEKGKKFVEDNLNKKLVFFDQLYAVFNDEKILQATTLLASLNYSQGNKKVYSIDKSFFGFSDSELEDIILKFKDKFQIDIFITNNKIALLSGVSFSFYQSTPPEITQLREIMDIHKKIMSEFNNPDLIINTEIDHQPTAGTAPIDNFFVLDDEKKYTPSESILEESIKFSAEYEGKDSIFGGSDRFPSRVSPTNSIVVYEGKMLVNNAVDALDLLVPLRLEDPILTQFIENNTLNLVAVFIRKSDTWEKDQHYTWVRNCFRQFNMEATYSGSGGMLSRADVTVISPFVAGIEAKSPREGRGTINLKAVRQAIEAKIQATEKIKPGKNISKAAIAIGRRISTLAVNSEKSWADEGQPVLLMTDACLHYLVLKSASVKFSLESLISFFTKNHGQVKQEDVLNLFKENISDERYLSKVAEELNSLKEYFEAEVEI